MFTGGLVSRYVSRNNQSIIKLEFRKSVNVLQLPDALTNIAVQVGERGIRFLWQDVSAKAGVKWLDYKISYKLQGKDFTLVIPKYTSEYQSLCGSSIFDILQCDLVTNNLIVVFNSTSNEQSVLQVLRESLQIEFSRSPLKLNELSTKQQNRIENMDMSFLMPDNLVKLKDLFPDPIERNSELHETLILKLLGTEHTSIFVTQHLANLRNDSSQSAKWYIPRRLTNRDQISSSIFRKYRNENIFLVFNIEYENLVKMVDQVPVTCIDNLEDMLKENHAIFTNYAEQGIADILYAILRTICIVAVNLGIKCVNKFVEEMLPYFEWQMKPNFLQKRREAELILLKFAPENYKMIIEVFRDATKAKNIHLLRHTQNNTFSIVESSSSLEVLDELFSKCGANISEFDLISTIDREEQTERIILITDSPGMGKSVFSKMLAIKLSEMYKNRLIIHCAMNLFLSLFSSHGLNSGSVSVSEIIDAFKSYLCCSIHYEEHILDVWLAKPENNNVQVEIVFDGLDEVQQNLKEVAIGILQTIKSKLPAARVWVTARDHMITEIKDKFGVFGYKLNSFSESDQKVFFANYTNVGELEAQTALSLVNQNANFHNLNCPTEIPLICWIVAEVSKTKNISSGEEYSLANLYNQMVERKLQIFLDKRGITDDYTVHLYRKDMLRVHTKLALESLFSDKYAKRLVALMSEESSQVHWESIVLDQGLVQNLKSLAFIHRTFAEFIVARFVFKIITEGTYMHVEKKNPSFIKFLWKQILSIEVTGVGSGASCQFRHPVIYKFLVELLETWRNKNDCSESQNIDKLLSIERTLDQTVKNLFPKTQHHFAGNSPNNLLVMAAKLWEFDFCENITKSHLFEGKYVWENMQKFNKDKFTALHCIEWARTQCWRFQWFFRVNRYNEFRNDILSKQPETPELTDQTGRTPEDLGRRLAVTSFTKKLVLAMGLWVAFVYLNVLCSFQIFEHHNGTMTFTCIAMAYFFFASCP